MNLVVSFSSIYGQPGGPHCPNWFDRQDDVVLTQSRLTYSTGELSRMASAYTGARLDYSTLDPSLLAVEPGAATASPSGSPSGLRGIRTSFFSGCMFTIEITNTGAAPIQIPQAGLQLTADPQPNPTQYNLVEFCSVVHSSGYCGPNAGGLPPGCSVYGIEVALENQQSGGAVMSAPVATDPSTGQACPAVTLATGRTVTFVIAAYSTAAMTYQAVPVLQVITPTSQGPVAFAQLGAVYSFADPSQFTCYRLSGTTFTAWRQGAAAYDFAANQKLGAWCV